LGAGVQSLVSGAAGCGAKEDRFVAHDKLDTVALLKELAETPKRDNSAYHQAIAEARQAFAQAEVALGGAVRLRTKSKLKRSGKYVVKWTFERLK
jgi:hypothetical protein